MQLLVQEKREGKTSAINLFLANAKEKICVLESGDTIPHEDAIENMVRMFSDPGVGMTGAHKVPVNTPEHIIGYLSHLRLKMEHQLCLEIPRLGELIAFRKVFDHIPPDVAMDEAFVEALVVRRGLQVRYAPDAVVFNMGPETLGDFIKQRRRIYNGHIWLAKIQDYKVSTKNPFFILPLLLRLQVWRPRPLIWTLGAIALEAWSRFLGAIDYYIKKKVPFIWDISTSTKKVI